MVFSTPAPCAQRKLDELEEELVQMNGNAERLQKSFAELTELQLVLERAGGFFNDQQFRSRGTFEAGTASGAQLSAWALTAVVHGCKHADPSGAYCFSSRQVPHS